MGYISDILNRLAEMEKEALFTATNGRVDAVPYFPYQQTGFPYFYNRLASASYAQAQTGMDILSQVRQFNVRLVVAHLTEGYKGEAQAYVDEYLPMVIEHFCDPRYSMLQSTRYPTEMMYLRDELRIVSDTGLLVFSNSGVENTLQLGVEIVVELTLIR
jgi:hypothetical protein